VVHHGSSNELWGRSFGAARDKKREREGGKKNRKKNDAKTK